MRFKLFVATFVASFALLFAPAYADEPTIQDAVTQDAITQEAVTQDAVAQVAVIEDDEPLQATADAASSAQPGAAINAPDAAAGTGAAITTSEIKTEEVPIEKNDMLRLYNPNSGEHFYTADVGERDYLVNVGWIFEGLGWMAPATSDIPVYRLYNPNAGDHHYTTAAPERDNLINHGWTYEGIGWYSALEGEGTPVLRRYNPNAIAGAHNFSTDAVENAYLVDQGWADEGVAWFALASDRKTVQTEVTNIVERAPYLTASFTAQGGSAPETVVSYAKGNETYLFMPSYASLSNVFLNAYTSKTNQTNLFIGSDQFTIVNPSRAVNLLAFGASPDANGTLKLKFKTANDATAFPLIVMKSANVATVYINSNNVGAEGRAYVEADPKHETKANVAVYVVDPAGSLIYGKDQLGDNKKTLSTIKGRGNSTWGNGIKKPYQISLSSKADLVDGGGAAKKWILLANSADAALLHSSVAFNLATELGLDSIDLRPIDLYYDGEYRGSYLLAEKVQIGKGRIDIFDLEDAIEDANPGVDIEALPTAQAQNRYGNTFQYVDGVSDPASIDGGYVLELDSGYYASEKCWFSVTWPGDRHLTYFVLKSPEVASINAVKYISEAVQEAIDNMELDKMADGAPLADGGFAFDLDSFAKMYLLEEFLKNADAYVSSTYFYLDRCSKVIYSGPVWDFDAGMGTRTDSTRSIQSTYWGFYLYVYDNVKAPSIKARIQSVYKNQLSGLIRNVALGGQNALGAAGKLHSIAWYAAQIAASQRMNEIPFGVTSFAFQAQPFKTWSENVQYFKNWLSWRLAWFDSSINMFGDASLAPSLDTSFIYNGFDYGHVFDPQYYLAKNPSLASIGVNTYQKALVHFVNVGIYSDKYVGTTARNFNVKTYMAKNPQLKAQLGDDLKKWYQHYCSTGFKQGLVCI